MTEYEPDSVHSTLSKHILADGYEFVVDLDRSHGSRLYDSKADREILDLFSCFSSLPIGWNHPRLLEMEERLGRIAVNNITNSDLYSVEMAEAIDTIGRISRPDHLSHMFFVAGGALGVENALKAAMDWKQQDRTRKGLHGGDDRPNMSIAHLEEAFHGRSGYTMSLTNTDPNKTDRYVKFDWPRISNPKINFPLDESESSRLNVAEAESIASLHAAADANPDEIAALIIEPIQGEGGDNHFRPEYMQELERATHDIGALFIVDEVQTGMGGTGKMWAYEHYGVKPDLLAFGKKMQVCGMMGGERITDNEDNVFSTSTRINSTFGGNLVDMVRGAACLEVIVEEDLLDNATKVGEDLLKGLNELGERHDIITNVRGKGLFAAFTLPDRANRDAFRMQALDYGVFALNSGFDSIRLRPCLNLTHEEADEALSIFEQTTKCIESLQVA